jgi:hypothetical protein
MKAVSTPSLIMLTTPATRPVASSGLTRQEIDRILNDHFSCEAEGDVESTLETFTDDVLGIPGHGRRTTIRILHVFEFRDGLISRENVWIDAGAAIAQLTSGSAAATSAG